MPTPLTRAQLLAEVARVRLEAASLTVYADELERLAAKAPLTIGADSDTVQTQMHVESAGAGRSKGQFTAEQAKHGFVSMLIRRGLDVGVVAAELEAELKRRVPRSTVQAWYKAPSDPSFRAPPEDAVKVLKAKYGVPLSAWARIKAAKS